MPSASTSRRVSRRIVAASSRSVGLTDRERTERERTERVDAIRRALTRPRNVLTWRARTRSPSSRPSWLGVARDPIGRSARRTTARREARRRRRIRKERLSPFVPARPAIGRRRSPALAPPRARLPYVFLRSLVFDPRSAPVSIANQPSLPWRHRPFPELVRAAWPIAVSMLSYGVMTLVDTLFVGRLGASALAGVGLGGVSLFFDICFGMGALRGVKVLTSQAVGANKPELGRTWLGAGAIMMVAIALGSVAAGMLVASQIHHVADSAAAAGHAAVYLVIRALATPIVMMFVLVREYRYGLGDTRSPMVASVTGNLANIALDAVFVLGLDMGVAGVALATALAQLLELSVLLVIARKDLSPRMPTRAQLAELWRIGWPTGLQFQLELGSFALLTAIVASMGDVQLAAHQIALQVLHLSFLPTAALSEAAGMLAGQAVGAGRVRLVRVVARYALMGSAAYTGICTIILIVFGRLIASAFTDDPALLSATVSLLWIASLFQVADGAAIAARGVLRGVGDVKFPASVGIVAAWVCTPPMAWLLGHEAGLGALGGWIGLSVEIIACALIFWWRLERLGWIGHAKRARAQLALA
ncbi:MAG: MATE family efflux transporter [Sandaracinaceae bacterium]